jgi:hypothetical protein
MALAHNLTSLFCTIGAWVFFIIGCIGNSSDENNIKNAPWIRSQGENFNVWVGTQAFIYDNGVTEVLTKFRDCETTNGFCTPCKDNGRITFALMVIAVCFAMISIIFSAVSCGGEHSAVQHATVATTGSSLVVAIVGWCVFMRRCYHAVDDLVTQDMYYGAGSALSLLGFLLMGIAVIVNVVNMVHKCHGTNAPQRVPQTETSV